MQKVKKLIGIVCIVALVALPLAACNGEDEYNDYENGSVVSEQPSDTNNEPQEDWEVFLDEYEAWLDQHMAIAERMAEGEDVMDELEASNAEAVTFSDRTAEIIEELAEDAEALEEFMRRSAEIAERSLAGMM